MVISEQIYEEIEKLVDDACELESETKDFKNKYFHLANRLCGLGILQQHQISFNEVEIGNVIIKDDILICIYDGEIHKYRMEKRHAQNGELVYIAEALETQPFNTNYIGKCYRVTSQLEEEEQRWCKDCVIIAYDDNEKTPGWCLYDSQYIVLVPIN